MTQTQQTKLIKYRETIEQMEPNKEDDIAAKREARRQRIMANAKDRLTRITGRELNAEETQKINGIISSI